VRVEDAAKCVGPLIAEYRKCGIEDSRDHKEKSRKDRPEGDALKLGSGFHLELLYRVQPLAPKRIIHRMATGQ